MEMRLLIIANSAMNESSSNGRTLKNLLHSFKAEELAQFYINGTPDFSCCKHYYYISDNIAVKATIKPGFRRNIQGNIVPCDFANSSKTLKQSSQNIVKSCRNKYIRDLIWSTRRWWTPDLEKFLDDFAPQAVLLYAGDAAFMYDIARLIAQKRKIPLYMYNCENYVLKNVLYAGVKENSVWHLLLKNRLKKAYSRFMTEVKFCFYNTEYLEKEYQLAYPHQGRSCAIYTAANMDDCRPEQKLQEPFTLLYCGNLGVGRSVALLSLANVLYGVNPTAKLKIFGAFPDAESEKQLVNCPNVVFGGKISYEQVVEETKKCSMVVHCENPERVVNLQCAFSTKIADYLSCGVPMLIYALRDFPFVQYLEVHKAAHIAGNEDELKNTLYECTNNAAFRKEFVANAIAIANENHNLEKNGEFVRNIICG